MNETLHNKRLQYSVLWIVSLTVIGFTAILSGVPGAPFQKYFDGINALLVVPLVTVAGVFSLRILQARGWFTVVSVGTIRQGLIFSLTVAILFALMAVLVDLLIRFPKALNVPPPQALLFYPVIGYVIEVAFHMFPLALLLVLLVPFCQQKNPNGVVWLCILLVSVIEPVVQIRLGYSGMPFSWTQGYVALHVFVFNLVELYIFRRYDFVSMYIFRLVYYLYWHIIWGYLRLQLLF